MPYIRQADRRAIDPSVNRVIRDLSFPAGELNYVITRIVLGWLKGKNDLSYENLNAAIGVLECAKQELYRRMVAPYEDMKRDTNGEVYG